MAKVFRSKAHVSLFDIVYLDNYTEDQVFYGEYSTSKPRRWSAKKFVAAEEQGYDVIVKDTKYSEITKKFGFDSKNPYYSKILESRPLFRNSTETFNFQPKVTSIPSEISNKHAFIEKDKIRFARQCYHIEIDICESGLRYQTGDHVGTWPQNEPDQIIAIVNALQLSEKDMSRVFSMKPNSDNPLSSTAKMPFPVPCSVETALTYYLDLSSGIKQYQMEILAKYAKSEKERDRLFELADNRDLFLSVIEKGRKTLVQVLMEFRSVSVI
jgi:NADPH-ferrihemoprotein reductase